MRGQLLLIDAGCEIDGYTADVTRTSPIGARFSPAQRRLYEAVLETQIAAIEAVKPGATLDAIHKQVVEQLTGHMVSLGLLTGEVPALIEAGAYKQFYMHRTSHWLGMDVHDVGFYSEGGAARPLVPGMVLTIEPGLYVAADAPGAAGVPRPRRPHRGRHPGDGRRLRQPDRDDARSRSPTSRRSRVEEPSTPAARARGFGPGRVLELKITPPPMSSTA